MSKQEQTVVKAMKDQHWALMPNHIELYHRELLSAEEGDQLGIRANSILWEKIGVGGAVLPHYHNVAEIIHITKGKVNLLCNGQWQSYQEGDTFLVPAGVVHSVANNDCEPTEQISIFLPVESEVPPNTFFQTTLVDVALP
jgi:mannose-6-phosphate isomerase-like protein (cupin superfamily)